MMLTVWTIQLQGALERAVADGLTTTQIASRLQRENGVVLTKNAVMGRISRTGLQLHREPNRNQLPRVIRKQRDLALAKQRQHIERENKRMAEMEMPEPTPRGDVEDGCRWPCWGFGEEPTRNFCGAPKSRPTPYCGFHRKIAFNRVSTERAKIVCEAA